MNSRWTSWRLGRLTSLVLVLFFGAAAVAAAARAVGADWRTASREPAGIAPNPATTREAVVQIYAARAWGWRGAFGVHSWIAVKPTDASAFRVYQVIGWRAYYGGSALVIDQRAPDARWFGAEPELLTDLRGPGVDNVIGKIDAVARAYPYPDQYHVWPGPNSNTFVAYVARQVPELRLDLPPTAIGKDYIPGGVPFARSPSGTGYQLSLFGLLGVLAGAEEGLEVNLLGLTFGIDPLGFAVKLPMVGRIGPNNHRTNMLP